MYLWGDVSNYVVTYFHYRGDKSATLSNALLVIPLSLIVQSFFNIVGAFLMKRWHPTIILILGLSIMCGSILIATFCTSWWSFILVYSIGYPCGIGIVYWVPIILGWEWFPDRKGLVNGLIMGGYGFGSFVFGLISTAIANPADLKVSVPIDGPPTNDELFPKEVGERVPGMYRYCLIGWAILGLMAILGISRSPKEVKQEVE